MTMRSLNAHTKAYNMRMETLDRQMWTMGIYIQSAVTVAVEHCLGGKKAKSKYIEEPILEKYRHDTQGLSKDEKQRELDAFVMKLKAMETNFKLSKGNNND